ncbi:MAG: YdaS family helix-turn-helix protein [Asticcacaulis sp.]
MTRFEALNAVITAAGSQSALARICGVSQTAVWKWVQSSHQIPAEFVLKASAATGISPHDLRPDIYPRKILSISHDDLSDWDRGEYANPSALLDTRGAA